MFSLKEIWKNRKFILEGIKNSVIRDDFIEDVAFKRNEICKSCDQYDTEGSNCALSGTQPCCAFCGCSLMFKTRSLSSDCPLDKWHAFMTEEEEEKLEKL